MLPSVILEVIDSFQKIPGLGKRSSQKLALDLLELSPENYIELINKVQEMKEVIKFCKICGFFCDNDICNICTNPVRSRNQICLVEKTTDVLNIEKTQIYSGTYHILNKLISPIDNIFVQQTKLLDLLQIRLPELISKLKPDQTIELVIFFKAGFSADSTLAYIKDFIRQKDWQSKIIITKLAEGLPLYYNPDNLDQATIIRAIEDRRSVTLL